MSAERPSPLESATLFKSGTIKKGNDGNMWIIAKDKNGVNRWKKYDCNKHYVKLGKDNMIDEFKNSPKSVKKVGTLDIKSSVVVGEFKYNPDNGFTKFKKGTYFIYKLDDSLLLSKVEVDKKVNDITWKCMGVNVAVDGGTFGFWDLDWIKALNNCDEKMAVRKKTRRKTMNNIPSFNNIWTKSNYDNTLFIRIKDLDGASGYTEYGFDGEKVIGVVSPTGTGDGYFDCYVNKDNTM